MQAAVSLSRLARAQRRFRVAFWAIDAATSCARLAYHFRHTLRLRQPTRLRLAGVVQWRRLRRSDWTAVCAVANRLADVSAPWPLCLRSQNRTATYARLDCNRPCSRLEYLKPPSPFCFSRMRFVLGSPDVTLRRISFACFLSRLFLFFPGAGLHTNRNIILICFLYIISFARLQKFENLTFQTIQGYQPA